MTTRRAVASVVMVAAILAGAFVSVNLAVLGDEAVDGADLPYVRLYDDPEGRLEVLVNQGDGQSFAASAQDPSLARPEVYRAGPAEPAYRAQRPLLGWLAWGGSLGQAQLVPLVLVVLSAAGFIALGAALAWRLHARGANRWWALAVLVTPGALVTLDWTGPECLGTAAAIAGVGLWGDGRPRWAIALLVASGLCRETLLLVPIALAAHELIVRRRRPSDIAALGLPLVAYGAWVAVVWARLDFLPSDAGERRLSLPFRGLADAASSWTPADGLAAGLILLVCASAAVVGRRDPAGWIVGAFGAASLTFGADVWTRVEDFSRILLTAIAFATLVLVPRAHDPDLVRVRAPALVPTES